MNVNIDEMNNESTRRFQPLFMALIVLVAFTGVSLGFSNDAEARSRAKQLNVEFDHLEVTQERGRVVVDYRINQRDWRDIQRYNVDPRLEIHLNRGRSHNTYRYETRHLNSRSGTIVFRGAELGQRQVSVALEGSSRRAEIRRISLGRQRGDRVQVAVMRPAPPRRVAPAPERRVVRTPERRVVRTTEHRVVHRPAPAPTPRRGVTGTVTVRF